MTLPEPGFYDDVPEADYHADRDSLSHSGARRLLLAPALFRYELEHRRVRDTFDFGHAAHSLILGVGMETVVVDATDWRTKAAKEASAAAREEGKTPLLKADWLQVCAMADALSEHRLAMRLLSDGRPEVSAYARDEGTGVMRRCRFDWLATSVLTDYKTTVNADPRSLAGRYGAVKKYGYDQQAAWYTDLARDIGHPAKAFAFIFQMKEPPYLVTVATLRDEDLWDARNRNRAALELFAECTASGQWPGFLPDDTAAVVSLENQTYETEYVAS